MAKANEPRRASSPQKSRTSATATKAHEADEPLALPMQKTSALTYVALGVGAVLLLGLGFYFSGGGTSAPQAESGQPGALPTKEALSKEELKAREEHLKRTQAALEAAAREAPAPPTHAPAPSVAAPEAVPVSSEASTPGSGKVAAPSSKTSSKTAAFKPPAPKPVDSAKTKKKADALDALGADITSALK